MASGLSPSLAPSRARKALHNERDSGRSTEQTPLLLDSGTRYTAANPVPTDGADRNGSGDEPQEEDGDGVISANEFDLLLSRSASFSRGPMLGPESIEHSMLRGPRRYTRDVGGRKARRRSSNVSGSTSRSRGLSVSSAGIAEEGVAGGYQQREVADGGDRPGASLGAAESSHDGGEDSDAESGSSSSVLKSASPFLGGVGVARFWIVFGQILLAYFIACFDGTIMASSHPVITSYFHSSNSASWLSTAFLLTSTSFQPLLGRLSDSVGRKPPYVITMGIFLLATVWCALAGSMTSFIIARAVCGLGAGGMMTLGSIIISDLVPIELRGSYQAYINITYGIGSALGAALGGAMADHLGWRWEFGVQVPALCLCFIIATLSVPGDLGLYGKTRETFWVAMKAFDFRGSILLTVSITFLILGLNLGGNVLDWSHPFVIASLVIFAVCFPLFLHAETRASRPIMPLHLVYKSPHANLILSNHIAAFLINAILFNIPLFFQGVLLTTATSSGLWLVLPSAVSSLVGTATGFLITYTRRLKWPLTAGTAFLLLGTLSLAVMRRGWPAFLYLLCLVPGAVGQGFQFPGTFMAVLAASDHRAQAVVTSTLILWRSLGMVLGVAVSSLVVQNALRAYLEEFVTGLEEERWRVIATVRRSVEAIRELEPRYRDQVIMSYEAALRLMFLCCSGLALVSVLLILPVKLPRLGSRK